MACIEQEAKARDRALLVLDTASGDAERLYTRGGWQRVGTVPGLRDVAGRWLLRFDVFLEAGVTPLIPPREAGRVDARGARGRVG